MKRWQETRTQLFTSYLVFMISDMWAYIKCDDKTEGEQYDQMGRELYVTLKQSVSLKKNEKV